MAKNKEIRGWRKASFFDPATGDVVQVNKIMPEFSSWEPDVIRTEDTIGSVYGGKMLPLVIGSTNVDQAKKDQLTAWMDAGIDIQAVVYNPMGKNIQWLTGEELFYIPAAGSDARQGAAVHQMQLDFTGVGSAIYQRRNLIAKDSFPVVFPIAGVDFTYSITTATVGTLTIYFEDFAGATLAQKQVATAAGRISVTEKSPAGTYQITVDEPGDASDQALRTDGSDQPTTM